MPRGVNAYDEARLQGRLWLPSMLGPGKCAVWFHADLSSLTLASGVVSQWSDKSGNARHATQATAGDRPALEFSGPFRGIRFADTDDRLLSSGWTTGAGVSLAHVLFMKAPATWSGFPVATLSNSYAELNAYRVDADKAGGFYGGAVFTVVDAPSGSTGQADPYLLSVHFNGPNTTGGYNGKHQLVTNTGSMGSLASNPPQGSPGEFHIGYSGLSPTDAMCGGVVALMNPTLDDIQRVEGFMAWDQGYQRILHPSHPYSNRPPLIGG